MRPHCVCRRPPPTVREFPARWPCPLCMPPVSLQQAGAAGRHAPQWQAGHSCKTCHLSLVFNIEQCRVTFALLKSPSKTESSVQVDHIIVSLECFKRVFGRNVRSSGIWLRSIGALTCSKTREGFEQPACLKTDFIDGDYSFQLSVRVLVLGSTESL